MSSSSHPRRLPPQLVDVVPSAAEAQRLVEAVGQRAVIATWHAKLAAVEAAQGAGDAALPAPIGEGMLRAQQQMVSRGRRKLIKIVGILLWFETVFSW